MKGGVTWEYTFDTENRLTVAKKNGKVKSQYTYDGDGGRTKKVVYPECGQALLDEGDENLKYAFNGQGIEANADSRRWNADSRGLNSKEIGENPRLISEDLRLFIDNLLWAIDFIAGVKDAEARVLYTIAPDGEGGGGGPSPTTTKYVGSLLEEEYNGQHLSNSRKYIFLGDTRVVSIDNGQVLYYHGNHLGSTDVVTNAAGEQVVHYEYEPYGVVTATQGSDISKFKFTGKPLDDETGLYYYGARYYNPALGRFITADPIVQSPGGNPQTLNRYSYCNNNPVNNIDPTGHSWFKKFWTQIFSVVSGIATLLTTWNPVLAFQVYSWSSTILSTGQALASGANIGRVLGSLGAGLAIGLGGAGLGIGNIANLGLRMGAFAVQGAAIGAAGSAIMGGDIGIGAAWGAGFGAATGFLTSQQFTNWRNDGQFTSDKNFAKFNQRMSDLMDPLGSGSEFGLVASEGHTGMTLGNGETGTLDFVGKYPSISAKESAWITGKTADGALMNEFNMPQLTNPFVLKSGTGWSINYFQYGRAMAYVQNPGTFSLTTNCAEFALRTARYIGINAPSNLTTFGFTDPKKVMGWLNSIRSYGAGL